MSETNPATPGEPQPDPNLPPDVATRPPSGTTPEPAPAPAPPKKTRRFPRWLKVVGVILLLLGLVVLFAPTIASTGPVRNFVLGKVNQNLNGKVEAAGWSLGWTTGLKISGLRVLDAAGQPILQIASLTTDLSLVDIARQNFSLGDAVVDGLDFTLRREADGEFNFSKLTKPAEAPAPGTTQPQAPQPESPPAPAPAEPAPTKLPDLSGRLIVRNSRGTYEDVVKKQVVQFPAIDGNVNIPSINAPIENALTVVAATGGQQGTLKVSGTADVIENNEVRVATANVDEKIDLQGLGMSAVAAFLPPGGIERMDGLTNATVTLKMTAGQSGVVAANVTTTNFAASGPALKGDTFRAREFALVVPPTTIDMSPGFGGKWANWPIRTGGEKPQPISVTLRHEGYEDAVTLGVNATPQALMNLAGNLKPGTGGAVDLSVAMNVGGLAKQLPSLFPERDGRRLSSGRLEQSAKVKLAADSATLEQSLSIVDLALTRTADGVVEKLQPIEQELTVSTRGGGWEMPDLRDIRLALASGFAAAEFGGKELAQLNGKATGDLAKAQRELGALVDMAGMRLAGTFDVTMKSSGDVASPTAPLDLALTAVLTGLQLDGVAGIERFRQGHTRLEAGAQVVRGEAGVQALNGVRVVARTGASERDLTLDSLLTADVKYVESNQRNDATGATETVRVAEVPRYAIERFGVNLPAAQRDFPEQLAALNEQGLRFESGTLGLAGSGSYTAGGITFDVKGGIDRLALTRTPPGAKAGTPVLRDFALNLDAAGSYAADGPGAGTRVSRLAIADNQKMLSVRKGDAEIVIPSAPDRRPSGEVVLGADLKKLLDVSRAMSADPAAPRDPAGPELESGRLDGTLKLAESPKADKLVALTGRLDATNINVRTEGEPIRNEKLALVPSVRFAQDFSVINVDFVTVEGRLVKGRIYDTVITPPAGDAPDAPPLAAVQKANVVLDFPQLADLHALIRALSPPEPVAAPPGDIVKALKPAAASTPPTPRSVRGTDVIGRPSPRAAAPAAAAPPPPARRQAAEAKPSEDAPAPPGRILGGTANLKLTLGRQGSTVVITPELTAKGLAVGAGDVSKDVGDVNVRTVVQLVPGDAPAAPDATLLQRLRELAVPTLTLTGAGANVKLERPLVIKDPAGVAAMNAVLAGRVNLAELLSTLEAWNGAKPGTMYPYAGDMTLRQEVSTAGGGGGSTTLVGRADIENFATTGEGAGKFAERRIALVNNLNLDSAAKLLKLNELSLAMETTNALRLAATGTIREYDTVRRLEDVALDLEYDAKPLWDVLRPIMDPETGGKSLEEFTLAGKHKRRMELSGSYPADDANAIRNVKAAGGFALDTLAGRGLEVRQLDLRFLLDQGILRLEHVGEATTLPTSRPALGDRAVAFAESLPAGASCNGGVLSVNGFTVDLTGEHLRLTTPDNHPLIRGATINPVVADTLLGRFVNPAFNDAAQAKGILDATVISCRGLALDTAMQSPDPGESGRAELRWSLTDLFLGQPELVALVSRIKPNALNENGFAGEIKDGRIVIQGGQVTSDMTFEVDKYYVKFNGGIGLAENQLANFFVTLPPDMFAAIDEKFGRYVPREGYRVKLSGTTDNWLQNASQSILPIIADLGVRAGLGSVLDRAIGGRDREREPARDARPREAAPPPPEGVIGRPREVAPDGQRPAAERNEPEDPFGALLERALGGERETDEEKEARRERARAERRAREAAAATQPAATQPADRPLTQRERERLRQEEKRREREARERQRKAGDR